MSNPYEPPHENDPGQKDRARRSALKIIALSLLTVVGLFIAFFITCTALVLGQCVPDQERQNNPARELLPALSGEFTMNNIMSGQRFTFERRFFAPGNRGVEEGFPT